MNIKPRDLDTAPNVFKIYVNKPHLDFDDVESFDTTQELILTEEEIKGSDIVLDIVKYTNVNKISIFIPSNVSSGDVTEICEIDFYGCPLHKTDMKNLKKVG